MGGYAWTEEEDAIVRQAYERAGIEPVDTSALCQRLPRRSLAAIHVRASRMGLGDFARHKIPGGKQPHPRKYPTAESLREAQSAMARERIARYGHPRGALGLNHTPEARAKISAASLRAWADPKSGFHTERHRQALSDAITARIAAGDMRSGYNRSAGGRRADLEDRYFRSSWEANYARFLNWLKARGAIQAWEFEPKTFVFETIKRGTRAYTPDFRVLFPDGRVEWHEVKGWLDPKSKTRLARMRKYFPGEVVKLIDETWFRWAKRQGWPALLPGWESRGRGSRGC